MSKEAWKMEDLENEVIPSHSSYGEHSDLREITGEYQNTLLRLTHLRSQMFQVQFKIHNRTCAEQSVRNCILQLETFGFFGLDAVNLFSECATPPVIYVADIVPAIPVFPESSDLKPALMEHTENYNARNEK